MVRKEEIIPFFIYNAETLVYTEKIKGFLFELYKSQFFHPKKMVWITKNHTLYIEEIPKYI